MEHCIRACGQGERQLFMNAVKTINIKEEYRNLVAMSMAIDMLCKAEHAKTHCVELQCRVK
jgi:hypothetical protein